MRAHHEVEALLKKFEQVLLEAPRTMRYLEHRFRVHRSTIWKWANWLEERGKGRVEPIDRRRPSRYTLDRKSATK